MLEGEIFGKLGRWFETHLPGWIQQSLHECPICMQFWYGSAIYWAVYRVGVVDWLLTVIPCIGLAAVLVRLWPKEEIEVDVKPDKQNEEWKAQSIYKKTWIY